MIAMFFLPFNYIIFPRDFAPGLAEKRCPAEQYHDGH
jgi:hypothetical protein